MHCELGLHLLSPYKEELSPSDYTQNTPKYSITAYLSVKENRTMRFYFYAETNLFKKFSKWIKEDKYTKKIIEYFQELEKIHPVRRLFYGPYINSDLIIMALDRHLLSEKDFYCYQDKIIITVWNENDHSEYSDCGNYTLYSFPPEHECRELNGITNIMASALSFCHYRYSDEVNEFVKLQCELYISRAFCRSTDINFYF